MDFDTYVDLLWAAASRPTGPTLPDHPDPPDPPEPPPPGTAPWRTVRVDPNFDISAQPAAARPYLTRVEALVASERARGTPSGIPNKPGANPTDCAMSMQKERIGRNVQFYIMALAYILRLTGAPWAVLESIRLLTIMRERWADVHAPGQSPDGYKNFRWNWGQGEGALSRDDYNEKEEALVWAAIIFMVYLVRENLSTYPYAAGLVAFWQNAIKNDMEPKMQTKVRGERNSDDPADPYTWFTVDSIVHPYTCGVRAAWYMAQMYPDDPKYAATFALRMPRWLASIARGPAPDGSSALIWPTALRSYRGGSSAQTPHQSVYAQIVSGNAVDMALAGMFEGHTSGLGAGGLSGWLGALFHGLTLAFTPPDGKPFKVWQDSSSSYIDAWVYKTLGGTFYRSNSKDSPAKNWTVGGAAFYDVGQSDGTLDYYRARSYPLVTLFTAATAWGTEADAERWLIYSGSPGAWRGNNTGENAIMPACVAFAKVWQAKGYGL